jgi:hypothetical protein
MMWDIKCNVNSVVDRDCVLDLVGGEFDKRKPGFITEIE